MSKLQELQGELLHIRQTLSYLEEALKHCRKALPELYEAQYPMIFEMKDEEHEPSFPPDLILKRIVEAEKSLVETVRAINGLRDELKTYADIVEDAVKKIKREMAREGKQNGA